MPHTGSTGLPQQLRDRINDFCDKLRQRRVGSSIEAAKATADLLRSVVTSSRLADPQSLLDEVRSVGIELQLANPSELSIGNIVRRVMHIIREEMEAEQDEADDDDEPAAPEQTAHAAGGLSRAFRLGSANWGRTPSLHTLLDQGVVDDAVSALRGGGPAAAAAAAAAAAVVAADRRAADAKRSGGGKQPAPQWERRQEAIDGVNDLLEELKDIDSAIAAQAVEHIHANEVILTYGACRTVASFLRRAREKRAFEVVVAEAAPGLGGHGMAASLAGAGITATAISDAAIFAMMARVNKVVVSARALLADGGVMAPVGMRLVAMAARRHSVPFVVLVGMYQLTPLFPHEPGVSFNEFRSPAELLPPGDPALLAAAEARAGRPGGGEAGSSDEESGSSGDEAGLPRRVSSSGDLAAAGAAAGPPFLHVLNPSYDYVPPDLISLFITDHGHGFMPSYVYRQLSEFYHRQDYSLCADLY